MKKYITFLLISIPIAMASIATDTESWNEGTVVSSQDITNNKIIIFSDHLLLKNELSNFYVNALDSSMKAEQKYLTFKKDETKNDVTFNNNSPIAIKGLAHLVFDIGADEKKAAQGNFINRNKIIIGKQAGFTIEKIKNIIFDSNSYIENNNIDSELRLESETFLNKGIIINKPFYDSFNVLQIYSDTFVNEGEIISNLYLETNSFQNDGNIIGRLEITNKDDVFTSDHINKNFIQINDNSLIYGKIKNGTLDSNKALMHIKDSHLIIKGEKFVNYGTLILEGSMFMDNEKKTDSFLSESNSLIIFRNTASPLVEKLNPYKKKSFGYMKANKIDISKSTLSFETDIRTGAIENGDIFPIIVACSEVIIDKNKQIGKVKLLSKKQLQEIEFYEGELKLVEEDKYKILYLEIKDKKIDLSKISKDEDEKSIFKELIKFDTSLKMLSSNQILKISRDIKNFAKIFVNEKDMGINLSSHLINPIIFSRFNVNSLKYSINSFSNIKLASGRNVKLFSSKFKISPYFNLIGGYGKSNFGNSYSYGFAIGADKSFSKSIFGGIYLSYLNGASKLENYNINNNNLQFGIYSRFGSKLEFDTLFKYNVVINKLISNVSINNKGYANISNYHIHSFGSITSIGYRFNLKKHSIKPYINLNAVFNIASNVIGFLDYEFNNSFNLNLSNGLEYRFDMNNFSLYAIPNIEIPLFNTTKRFKVTFQNYCFDIKLNEKEYFAGLLLGGNYNIKNFITSFNTNFKISNKKTIFLGIEASIKYMF